MKKKRDPLSTEAAIKKATLAYYRQLATTGRIRGSAYGVGIYSVLDGRLLAAFDIRDLYRKRKPLKGVTKRLRKAVR
jgi:hypothetical protein